LSDFSGGFLLQRVDAAIQQPVIDATREYLLVKHLAYEPYRLTFATQRGCPVMHVAVRSADPDGQALFVWHSEHAAMAGYLARAIGQPVWAYGYENRVGYEMTWRFSKDGTAGRANGADRGQLHEQLRLGDSDADRDYLDSKLPLGKLATQLNVHRKLLETGLALATPSCSVPLDGSAAPEALAHYLAGPLVAMREPPNPKGTKTTELSLLASVAEEVQQLAAQIELPVGTLLWAGWEAGKAVLYKSTQEVDRFGASTGAMRVPKAQPPEELSVPPRAPEPPALPASTEKVKLTVVVPKRVLTEAQAVADVADRSLNWALQQAWLHARDRMRAAVRSDAQEK
jgi:hypothetical protein